MHITAGHVRSLCFAHSLTAIFFAFSLPAVAAGSYCSPPAAPFCLDTSGDFTNEQSKISCRAKLESYLSGVEQHANCLLSVAEEEARQRVEQGRREAAAARDEGKEVLARFECKARGRTSCY